MQDLNIIKASAGSGKTWTLTLEYLRILFRAGETHRHILAVTFTNKATEEMRVRILKELSQLAKGENTPMGQLLREEFKLSSGDLRERAARNLQSILHDYSSFTITTIDSFFQRILKAFARETGIPFLSTVELQTEKMLSETVDHIFFEMDRYPELQEWFINMSLAQVGEGKSWDIRNDLRRLGKEVLSEDFPIPGKLSPEERYQREQGFYTSLVNLRKEIGNLLLEMKSATQVLLDKHGLSSDDFSGKSTGIIHFFERLDKPEKIEFTKTIRNALEDSDSWLPKKSDRRPLIESIVQQELQPRLRESLLLIRRLNSVSAVLKYYHVWGILSDLGDILREQARENNLSLLSDTPKILHALIANNDTPFLYERAGNRWNHIMIDEFQDTSTLQWNNFVPLIDNSIASGNDCILVGDVKQSIYRWRNGDWRILGYEAERRFSGRTRVTTLPGNFRSQQNIIRFNNAFFSMGSALLQEVINMEFEKNHSALNANDPLNRMIQDAYKDCEQVPGPTSLPGGWVEITLFDPVVAEIPPEYPQIAAIIIDLLSKGYHQKDIAILLREKKNGRNLASYLTNSSILPEGMPKLEIISGESLFLVNSPAINSLVGAMRMLETPDDRINNAHFIREYFVYLKKTIPGNKDFPGPSLLFSDILSYLPGEFADSFDVLRGLPVNSAAERITGILGLDQDPLHAPYLDAFFDAIGKLTGMHLNDLHGFLDWWSDHGEELSLDVPANQDALRMMTIHKAKGLEFPVVILPDISWELGPSSRHREILWCQTEDPVIGREGPVPVTCSSKLGWTIFERDYYIEKIQAYIDQLNLLYVAQTRPETGLIMLCPQPEKKDALSDTSQLIQKLVENISKVFPCALQEKEGFRTFSWGQRSAPSEPPITPLTELKLPNVPRGPGPRIKLRRKAHDFISAGTAGRTEWKMEEGILLHQVFERMKTAEDLLPAISQLEYEGTLTRETATLLRQSLPPLFEDKEVAEWFSPEWQLRNECEILLPEGHLKRPDRVLFQPERTLVIDYKFGQSKREEHIEQVREYLILLRDAGFPAPSGFVWYVKENKKIHVNPV
ncbi:MAG: UvrD-helicase domain-containing protein [Bacteroidales bacterium]